MRTPERRHIGMAVPALPVGRAGAGATAVTRPKTGDKVRHIGTGDTGTIRRFDHPGDGITWAMVEWKDGGPGLIRDGLAIVAPLLLERVP